ncbi:MAG: transglycosylase domain-containing protein, partial [Anaerolineales bacterium]|nr:transglycosylase domain-containing protein [Anaerolineales bacterium]
TFQTTRIYDRNGELLWEIFGEGNRTYITIDQIPLPLQQATIAVEDDTFYENQGADIGSLVAALIANLRNPDGRPVGGSTITQQIVRHIAFDYEERVAVSYNRKIKEIVLAWMMTRDYSKDEILELYLNEIYYGNLAYGIEAAAETYFDKSAADLSLAEATLLAGLPQAPIDLDPLTYFEAAKEKQWVVLHLMAEEGFIEQDQIEPIYFTELSFAKQEVSIEAPHFTTYVRQILEEQFGAEMVANGGLIVTTSIDLRYQRIAERLAQQHVSGLRADHNLTNAALVAMKPSTGEVLAMLGSVDYKDDTIDGRVNVALTPQQPGSSIKPITYAAAISPDPETGEARWTAGDIIWDVKTEYPNYVPVNYDGVYHGPIRMRQALSNSYNVPAVLVLQDIGVPYFIDFAAQMGINSFGDDPSRYGLSLTLGGGELTPLELTTAYATFANEGYRVEPRTILKVENSAGEVLYQFDPNLEPEQVLDPRVAFIISDILADDRARVPAMGVNNPLDLPFPAAAKTGTTNDFRDNWTMGYTPGLVVGVWAGNTDNSEMINVTGLTGAAPLWGDYMQAIYSDFDLMATLGNGEALPPTEFVPPAGVEQRPLCNLASITLGATACSFGSQEWFLVDEPNANEPTPDPNQIIWRELDPSVVVAPAVPLPPAPIELVATETAADPDALPQMTACHFAQGFDIATLPADAAEQVFVRPPRNPETLKAAYEWGIANGVEILPYQNCNEELLALSRDPNAPAVWRITSPKAGDELDGVLPIMGTADFTADQVQFYKIELGMPRNGNLNDIEWLTLGDTHNTPVVNGQLETLYAAGLQPGEYFIRLIVVKWDGNYVGEPHTIPFTIVRQ